MFMQETHWSSRARWVLIGVNLITPLALLLPALLLPIDPMEQRVLVIVAVVTAKV